MAPPPTSTSAQAYSVTSEQADPASGRLELTIRTSGETTQSNLKAITEGIIASRKGQYRNILVRAYVEGANAADEPLLISRLENDSITHRFSPMAETKKIPTH